MANCSLVLAHLMISEAFYDMVVDHPSGLHMSIYNCGTHKFESALYQVFAESLGFRGLCGNLSYRLPRIFDLAAPYKLPDIPVKSPEFTLSFQESFRISYRGSDLSLVADNPWILK